MKCLICGEEVPLRVHYYNRNWITLVCPVCGNKYVGNLDVKIEIEGLKVKVWANGEVKINLPKRMIPVYSRAYKEKWDTKRLLSELVKS